MPPLSITLEMVEKGTFEDQSLRRWNSIPSLPESPYIV